MKVSARADAAIRAALGLAATGAPATLKDLSARCGVPSPFLQQLLGDLRRRGLVASRAGRRGGYALTRPPESISVGEVLRAVEGSLAPIACAEAGGTGRCREESACTLRHVWVRVHKATTAVVDGVTLRDLAGS